MTTSGSRQGRFLPYAHERVTLLVDRCRLDESRLVEPDPAAFVVDLTEPWDRARIDGRLVIERGLLERVVPPPERTNPSIEAWLLLRCDATRWRRGEKLGAAPVGVEELLFELSLRRSELRGSVELTGALVRASPAGRVAGYASSEGARVAGSRTWELRVDRARPRSGKYLDVRYRSFKDDPGIPKHDRGCVYLLEDDVESPILWINSDHQQVAKILESQAAGGRHARLRELFFDPITSAVWARLFLRAAGDKIGKGEAIYPWQDGVLDELLPDLYPELTDAAARARQLEYEWDDLPQVLLRLDAALQRRNDLAKHMIKLAEEDET